MPLQVSRVATARATALLGSSFNSAAISLHSRPNAAMVRGPTSSMNSSEPTPKRPSASMCQTKRSGWRRSAAACWCAAAARRRGSDGVRRRGRSGRRGLCDCRGAACAGRACSERCGMDDCQHGRCRRRRDACAATSMNRVAQARCAAGTVRFRAPLAASVSMPSADKRGGAGEPRLRRGIGINERAVGRESRDGVPAVGEQSAHALAERERRSRRLGRGDKHRAGAVGNNDARAGADQRAAETRAKAAQPLEALLRARRQRRGKTDDLDGRRVAGVEAALRQRGYGCGVEDRRADRIGPQNARAVGAPQPCRPRTRRERRETRMTQQGELSLHDRHARWNS